MESTEIVMDRIFVTPGHINLWTDGAEDVDLRLLFPEKIPNSVSSLIYNLRQLSSSLDQNLDTTTAQAFLIDTIGIVYQAVVLELDEAARRTVFQFIVQRVAAAEDDAAALLVFVRFEPSHHLACQATWAYLKSRQASFDNPMAATRDLTKLLTEGEVLNRGAVFAGLVCFGDRRICSIARTIRNILSPAEVRSFALAVTLGPLHLPSIEFCLTWLVDLVNRRQFEVAIPLASAMSAMVVKDSALLVHENDYNFGPFGFGSATSYRKIRFSDLLVELSPILDSLSHTGNTALDQMLEIFMDPGSSSLDQLERRRAEGRRNKSERRASDRRIVDLAPHIERRAANRRGDERRLEMRR